MLLKYRQTHSGCKDAFEDKFRGHVREDTFVWNLTPSTMLQVLTTNFSFFPILGVYVIRNLGQRFLTWFSHYPLTGFYFYTNTPPLTNSSFRRIQTSMSITNDTRQNFKCRQNGRMMRDDKTESNTGHCSSQMG